MSHTAFPAVGVLGAAVALALSSTPAVFANDDLGCEVSSWSMEWGVKESFRSYLSGSIAKGEWSTSGNVSYETPVFTIAGSSGMLASDLSSGELVTEGSIRFVGHGGILDQTLATPRVVFDGKDTVLLVFDVSGATQEGVFVDSTNVEFVELDTSRAVVDAEAGVWEVVDAPAVLTEEGHLAFGTYPAGEPFDPVTLRVVTEPGCVNPSGSPMALALIGGGALAVVLAVLATVWVRKSRGQERPTPGES